jgi:hypothetical protein
LREETRTQKEKKHRQTGKKKNALFHHSKVFLDGLDEGGLWDRPNDHLHLLPPLKQHDSGDGADAVLGGDGGGLVRVELVLKRKKEGKKKGGEMVESFALSLSPCGTTPHSPARHHHPTAHSNSPP